MGLTTRFNESATSNGYEMGSVCCKRKGRGDKEEGRKEGRKEGMVGLAMVRVKVGLESMCSNRYTNDFHEL